MASDKMLRSRFEAFVKLINYRPMMWTIGLMIPIYVLAFAIAFIGLLLDPHLRTPVFTFSIITAAALLVMTYHWVFSRFQHASYLAQAIQFFAGLIPVVGGLIILLISQLATS